MKMGQVFRQASVWQIAQRSGASIFLKTWRASAILSMRARLKTRKSMPRETGRFSTLAAYSF